MREVGSGAERCVSLQCPSAVGRGRGGGDEGATTGEADCSGVEIATRLGFGVGVFDGGEIGKVFWWTTVVGLGCAGGGSGWTRDGGVVMVVMGAGEEVGGGGGTVFILVIHFGVDETAA